MTITRNLTQPLTRAITNAITQAGAGGGGGAFVPNAAFFAGRAGFAIDFTDASLVFQNSNGTGAVTAATDPIGYATDLSGNGHHATQASGAARPLYDPGQGAVGDGTKLMTLGAVDFSGTDKLTIVVCVKSTTTANQGIYQHGSSLEGDARLMNIGGNYTGTIYTSGNDPFSTNPRGVYGAGFKVVTCVMDRAQLTDVTQNIMRVNGEAYGATGGGGAAASGNFGNKTSGLMTWFGGTYLVGAIARIAVIGDALSGDELFNIEYWAGQGGGLSLISEFPPAGEAYYSMVNSYGQSLSCGVSTGGSVLSSTTRFNDVMPTGGVFTTTTGAAWVPLVETFRNVSASDCYETPVSGMAEILHERGKSLPMVGACAGLPSLTIAQLKQGQIAYNNLISQAVQGKRRARELFQHFKMRAVTWMQGEADGANGSYAADMATLVGTLNTDIKAATGQTDDVWMIVCQIGRAKIGLAQLDASDNTDLIRIAAPSYFLENYDTVHLTSEAYKIAGGYFGLAYKALILDGDTAWKPLQCTGSSVAGTTIDLTYNRTGLAFDTTIVSAQTNQGFAVLDAGLTPLTVSSVTIVGGNTVRIVVSSGTPAHVYYGFDDPTDHTANIAKGNLRDSQGDTIVFDGGGLNYPMHNWAVLQSITL